MTATGPNEGHGLIRNPAFQPLARIADGLQPATVRLAHDPTPDLCKQLLR
jgi:hypothetical protein